MSILSRFGIQEIILFASIATYSAVYSIVTVQRFLAFNAGVFDLGVNYQLLQTAYTSGLIPGPANPHPLAVNKLIYLILAPIFYVFPSIRLLLVLQSVWIALAALPIYLISLHYNRSKWVALGFGVSWLLYYPMAGVNWFDFHFMALFPTFFLFGFYAYLRGNKYASFLLMALACITDYLIPPTMVFFSLYLYISDLRGGRSPFRNLYAHFLVIFSAALFLFVLLYLGQDYLFSQVTVASHFPASLNQQEMYLIYMTAPLLFLSFLAPDIMLMCIPFLVMIFHNSYEPFVSPEFYQYPSLISPILFIAAARGFSRLNLKVKKIGALRLGKPLLAAVVIVNLIFAAFLTPVGQLATGNTYGQDFSQVIAGQNYNYNSASAVQEFNYNSEFTQHILPLLHPGDTVLIQDNMPQLMFMNYNVCLPGLISPGSIPDYAIADPYSFQFTNPPLYSMPQNMTMWNYANQYYNYDNYGIYGEAQGIVLLKRGYASAPAYYSPYTADFNPSNFEYDTAHHVMGNATFMNNITGRGFEWNGQASFLVPGSYAVNLTIITRNASLNDSFQFLISGMLNITGMQTPLLQKNVTIGGIGDENAVRTITFTMEVHSFVYFLQIVGENMLWAGSLGLIGVTIHQTSWSPNTSNPGKA